MKRCLCSSVIFKGSPLEAEVTLNPDSFGKFTLDLEVLYNPDLVQLSLEEEMKLKSLFLSRMDIGRLNREDWIK